MDQDRTSETAYTDERIKRIFDSLKESYQNSTEKPDGGKLTLSYLLGQLPRNGWVQAQLTPDSELSKNYWSWFTCTEGQKTHTVGLTKEGITEVGSSIPKEERENLYIVNSNADGARFNVQLSNDEVVEFLGK